MPNAVTNPSPWPRRAAVALVCATFPLIWVGGLVTSYEAGMAVHDWPTTFGYNMFLYPLADWLRGPRDVFIEHGHRLLASGVGLVSIAVALIFWRRESRPWVRWLAFGTLAAVIGQGLLGGLRVIEDQRAMALVHGCVAQLFFGLTVTLAAVSSAWWKAAGDLPQQQTPRASDASRWCRLAVITSVLAYVQVVFGAFQRHFHQGIVPHLILAAILTLHIALLVRSVLQGSPRVPQLVRPALVLVGLIAVQLALGTATWVVNHGWPVWVSDYDWAAGYVVGAYSHAQIWISTAHVATGALIFAVTWLVALRSMRIQHLLASDASAAKRETVASRSDSRGALLALAGEGAL